MSRQVEGPESLPVSYAAVGSPEDAAEPAGVRGEGRPAAVPGADPAEERWRHFWSLHRAGASLSDFLPSNLRTRTREGFLSKQGKRVVRAGTFVRRWFVLEGALLFYFKEAPDGSLDSVPPSGCICLRGAAITTADSQQTRHYTFQIESRFPRKGMGNGCALYILQANSPEEMRDWMAALVSASSFLGMELAHRFSVIGAAPASVQPPPACPAPSYEESMERSTALSAGTGEAAAGTGPPATCTDTNVKDRWMRIVTKVRKNISASPVSRPSARKKSRDTPASPGGGRQIEMTAQARPACESPEGVPASQHVNSDPFPTPLERRPSGSCGALVHDDMRGWANSPPLPLRMDAAPGRAPPAPAAEHAQAGEEAAAVEGPAAEAAREPGGAAGRGGGAARAVHAALQGAHEDWFSPEDEDFREFDAPPRLPPLPQAGEEGCLAEHAGEGGRAERPSSPPAKDAVGAREAGGAGTPGKVRRGREGGEGRPGGSGGGAGELLDRGALRHMYVKERWDTYWSCRQRRDLNTLMAHALQQIEKAGFLHKQGRGKGWGTGRWAMRWFALQDGLMYYLKSTETSMGAAICGCICIAGAAITPLPSYQSKDFVFQISSPLPRKPGLPVPGIFHLRASSEPEMLDWVENLQKIASSTSLYPAKAAKAGAESPLGKSSGASISPAKASGASTSPSKADLLGMNAHPRRPSLTKSLSAPEFPDALDRSPPSEPADGDAPAASPAPSHPPPQPDPSQPRDHPPEPSHQPRTEPGSSDQHLSFAMSSSADHPSESWFATGSSQGLPTPTTPATPATPTTDPFGEHLGERRDSPFVMESDLVTSIMSAPIKTVHAAVELRVAVDLMRRCNVSSLLVLTSDGEGPGIITKRDFITSIAGDTDSNSIKVGAMMTRPIATIAATATIRECSQELRRLHIRRLVVIDVPTFFAIPDRTLPPEQASAAGCMGIVSDTDIFNRIGTDYTPITPLPSEPPPAEPAASPRHEGSTATTTRPHTEPSIPQAADTAADAAATARAPAPAATPDGDAGRAAPATSTSGTGGQQGEEATPAVGRRSSTEPETSGEERGTSEAAAVSRFQRLTSIERAHTASKLWQIDFSEIQLRHCIGRGAYGEVCQGTWRGIEVAVKHIIGADLGASDPFLMAGGLGSPKRASEEEREEELHKAGMQLDFEREVGILASLRHPNVVLFLGACVVSPDLCLVMEFCARGSLDRVLHKSKAHLEPRKRIRMAYHAACGMSFLHSQTPMIIHRDLKPGNLLVGTNFEVKVCDFGLSRVLTSRISSRSGAGVGTPQYAAPEVLRSEPYTEKADVWSFGIVLWETLTRSQPFQQMETPIQLMAAVAFDSPDARIPPLPADQWTAQMQKLLSSCTDRKPDARPSFRTICLILQKEYKKCSELHKDDA